jgi:hypothetical protein
MSLLRLAFWLSVVVFMLPSDPQQQARLHAIVMSALGRVNTYCDPNDRTCGAGGEVWATFVKKAEFGLRLIGDIVGGVRTLPDGAPPPPDKRWTPRVDPRRPGCLPTCPSRPGAGRRAAATGEAVPPAATRPMPCLIGPGGHM